MSTTHVPHIKIVHHVQTNSRTFYITRYCNEKNIFSHCDTAGVKNCYINQFVAIPDILFGTFKKHELHIGLSFDSDWKDFGPICLGIITNILNSESGMFEVSLFIDVKTLKIYQELVASHIITDAQSMLDIESVFSG